MPAAQKPPPSSGLAEKLRPPDNVEVVLRGPDGKVKERRSVHNLVTKVGREAIMDRLLASPAIAVPTHMAIGSSSTAPAEGNTALVAETARVALGAKERANTVLTMKATFGAGTGTGEVKEAGVLNAASNGSLYSRATFSVVNKGAEDTLEITWTYTQNAE